MVPFRCRVSRDIISFCFEECNAAIRPRDVRVGLPMNPVFQVIEWTGRFLRVRVGRHLKLVTQTLPVCSNDDDPLDIVLQGFLAAFSPVFPRRRVGREHARRAMREEMDRCQSWFSRVLATSRRAGGKSASSQDL